MKVKEFIEGFNKAPDKNSYVKNCLVTDYIDFERKVAICNLIAQKLLNDNGDLIQNTPMVYENFILSLVREYTNIEIDKENALYDFNLIERNGVTEVLIKSIGKDATRFNKYLDMAVGDVISNHNNLVNHLNMKSDNITFIFDKLQEMFQKIPRNNLPENTVQSK